MEYNVENLFDTLHTACNDDWEFTPKGERQWSETRYWSKLGKLSRVIAAVGGDKPVDLLALVEVENDSAMHDLTKRTKLWRMGYQYVISRSNDARGINVALLYLPHRFRVINNDSIRVLPPNNKLHQTRDVLHVAGELITGDTLDVYVCHFPSRRGGKLADGYRAKVAKALREHTDSIMNERQHPLVLITGDFNAFYPEKLFSETLKVQLPHPHSSEMIQGYKLYLLTNKMKGRADVKGTYKYQGEWNQLDQFIVSGTLLKRFWTDAPNTSKDKCYIVDYPFLLQKDKSGEGVHPFRTYLGPYYQGGYSDHLPILLELNY